MHDTCLQDRTDVHCVAQLRLRLGTCSFTTLQGGLKFPKMNSCPAGTSHRTQLQILFGVDRMSVLFVLVMCGLLSGSSCHSDMLQVRSQQHQV